MERAGISMRSQLPGMRDKPCERENCFIHTSGGKGNCRVEGVVYQGTCMTCKDKGPTSKVDRNGYVKRIERQSEMNSVYYGETSRNGYVRGAQHMAALRNPDRQKDNAFVKHIKEYHQGDEGPVRYKMNIVKAFKRPLERQIWEGVEIHGTHGPHKRILMNSKLDHYQPAVGRIIISNEVRDN